MGRKRTTKKSYELTFWGHLDDLRGKLLWVAGLFILAFLTCYFVVSREVITYLLSRSQREFYYLSVFEPLLSRLKISFLLGLIASLPLFLLQISRFLWPALHTAEKRRYGALLLVLLAGAAALGYLAFRHSPRLLEVFLFIFRVPEVKYHLSVATFLAFHVMLLAGDLLLVIVPLATLTLARSGVLDVSGFGRLRRFAYPILLLLSAMVTPPDPVTMLVVAIPLGCLFELALFLARLGARTKPLSNPLER